LRKPIAAAALIALVSLLSLGAGSAGATSTTWVVDDDGMATPRHCDATTPAPTSVNAAIALASPGDKIQVCPGTYPERVVVDKSLTLIGDTASLSRSRCVAGTGGVDPAKDTIVNGIDVKSNNVTIRNFTTQNAKYPAMDAAPGIQVGSPAQDWVKLQNNVIQKNLMGVYLNGAHDRVVSNCIRDNNVAGSAAGSGIYSDQGLTNSTIEKNNFTGHENVAVNVIGSSAFPVSNVKITKNNAINDSTIMVIGVNHVDITKNVSRHALYNGIQVDDPNSPGISNDVDVENNTISSCGFSGIQLFGTVNSDVQRNSVRDCGDRGIGLRVGSNADGAAWNQIDHNILRNNGTNGIEAVAETHDNRIERNTATGNAVWDCLDSSTGTKTAGTANTWVNNLGPKASPPAICHH
jgi:parallel beta-helix repeat protein